MISSKVFKFIIISLIIVLFAEAARKLKKLPHNPYGNEIMTKPEDVIIMRLPSVFVPVKSNIMGRKAKVKVEPVQEDCTSKSFSKELQKTRLETKCEPRPTLVHLESKGNSRLIPNAVMVKRCGGMCSASLKCIATETVQITKYLREIKLNNVYCTTVTISEDIKCKCDCPQKATDCGPLQEYDSESCRCQCRNLGDRMKCEDPKKRKKFYWHEQRCECLCKETKNCTTGSSWDAQTCRCKPNKN